MLNDLPIDAKVQIADINSDLTVITLYERTIYCITPGHLFCAYRDALRSALDGIWHCTNVKHKSEEAVGFGVCFDHGRIYAEEICSELMEDEENEGIKEGEDNERMIEGDENEGILEGPENEENDDGVEDSRIFTVLNIGLAVFILVAFILSQIVCRYSFDGRFPFIKRKNKR